MFDIVPGLKRYQMIQNLVKKALENEPTLLPHLRYAKIKHNVLFFVFNHPSLKQEFEYKKENVLNALRMAYKERIRAYKEENVVFSQIRAAVVFGPQQMQETRKTDNKFAERARGEFKNLAKNPVIFGKFEEIRAAIKSAHTLA